MLTAAEIKRMPRKIRRPKHDFQLRYRPFTVQPFMIAPVLAGETLKHGMLQARTVTDPIKNPLIGWWQEHWIFYVKLTDLYDRDKLVAMLMNPEESMTSLDSATNLDNYHENGSSGSDIDYVKLCLQRVVDEYFRYEGETSTSALTTITSVAGNTVPVCQYGTTGILDSFINDADYQTPADEELLDISAGTAGGGDDKLMISEIANAQLRYDLMKAAGLTQMTYEEYMASYSGETAPAPTQHKPELLRYVRDWTYPTNTIDPTNGTPRSACSWVTQATMDKARRFDEHGFIFGVTTARPKVYLKGLSSNAVMLMKSAQTWFPPSLMHDPYANMVKVAAGDPPVTNNTDSYWVDLEDILNHGDQFINFALTATDANIFGNPAAAGTQIAKRYPVSADIDALFVSASPLNQIRSDGVFTPSIAGRHSEDRSPNFVGTAKTV